MPYDPTVTASSGLAVSLSVDASSTTGACSVSGGVVSFTGVGSCVLDANQAGNANFAAAPQVQQPVTVGKGSQTITPTSTAPTGAVAGGPTYSPSASNSSGLSVTFTIDASASSVCSITAGS